MAYRDDNEALLAKIASLEEANAELEREIQRLRADPVSGGEPSALERVIGSRLVLDVERTIDGELPERERMRIAETIASSLGQLGRPLFVGGSVVLRGGGGRECRPPVHVTVTSRGGKTRIQILERRSGLAGGLAGGAIGTTAAGIGPLMGLLPLFGPRTALIALPLWTTGVLTSFRALFAALGRRRARELDAIVASAAASATELVVVPSVAQVRVETEAATATDAASEERGDRRRLSARDGAR